MWDWSVYPHSYDSWAKLIPGLCCKTDKVRCNLTMRIKSLGVVPMFSEKIRENCFSLKHAISESVLIFV